MTTSQGRGTLRNKLTTHSPKTASHCKFVGLGLEFVVGGWDHIAFILFFIFLIRAHPLLEIIDHLNLPSCR